MKIDMKEDLKSFISGLTIHFEDNLKTEPVWDQFRSLLRRSLHARSEYEKKANS